MRDDPFSKNVVRNPLKMEGQHVEFPMFYSDFRPVMGVTFSIDIRVPFFYIEPILNRVFSASFKHTWC